MSSKSPKKSGTKKKASSKKEPVVEVPEPVVEVPVEEPVVETINPICEEVEEQVETHDDVVLKMTTQFNTIKQILKELELDLKKLKKLGRAKKKKKKVKTEGDTDRPKNGFAKPTNISPELAKFLGVDKDTLVARTKVTQIVNKYIKEHSLQDPANKRNIQCDAVLKKLLNVTEKDAVSYFNLQKFLKPHFPKSVVDSSKTVSV